MANISIISRCNRSCSYCFAAETMQQAGPLDPGMSTDQFQQTLDFLEQSGIHEARILGGEPTIHPKFLELLDLALGRGMRVMLFSGGLIPAAVLERLAAIPVEQLRVLLNVAIPGESSEAEMRRQQQVMRRLGPRVILGINIHRPSAKLDFLLDWIREHGLARSVRLGLTHPTLGDGNDHLHPRHFEEIGVRVARFAANAKAADVQLDFDCGWVPCMFPAGSLEALGIAPREVGLRCDPILDVMPNGDVIPCFPLADYLRRPLSEFQDERQMYERFTDLLAPARPLGMFRKCADCDFRRRGECSGGCLSRSLRRLHGNALEAVEVPRTDPVSKLESDVRLVTIEVRPSADLPPVIRDESTPTTNRWAVPYIDQPESFWRELDNCYGDSIAEVYFPLPGDLLGTGRPPQPDSHLQSFLQRAPQTKGVLLNGVTLPRPVGEVAPDVIAALRHLSDEYGVTNVTVTDLSLARRLRDAFPDFTLTASVLMEISEPFQARLLNGVCDVLVPASRVVRDLPALRALRASFSGRIRLLVNESCLAGCPFRTQHFHEMASGVPEPKSLCGELLHEQPWLRLTGSWILPQYLRYYEGVYDELKLAGRVTLRHPEDYHRVLGSYVRRDSLAPHEIGGGPSSVIEPIEMDEELFRYTLTCGRRCHECTRCPDFYQAATKTKTAAMVSARDHLDHQLKLVCW